MPVLTLSAQCEFASSRAKARTVREQLAMVFAMEDFRAAA